MYALPLKKTCKKKTCLRSCDFQMVKQKSSDALESAMAVETAQDKTIKNAIQLGTFNSGSFSSISMKTKVMGHFFD